MMNILEINNVKKHFKEVRAVDGISFSVAKGEFLAVLGPNGAGKTTLLEMIEGIQYPDSGSITISGLSWNNNEKQLRKILGICLQETDFIERLNVEETLELFASFYDLPKERALESMELVNLTEKRKALTKNLSGGQKQRLALGVALINKPELLLLDEPTTGLDPAARREIWEILRRLREEINMTLILTTHYMEEAEYLCERIIILDKGKILASGTLDELLTKYKKYEIIEFSISSSDEERFTLPRNNVTIELTESTRPGNIVIRVDDIVGYLPFFLEQISQQNIELISLECRKMTLDDLFISLTGRSLHA